MWDVSKAFTREKKGRKSASPEKRVSFRLRVNEGVGVGVAVDEDVGVQQSVCVSVGVGVIVCDSVRSCIPVGKGDRV